MRPGRSTLSQTALTERSVLHAFHYLHLLAYCHFSFSSFLSPCPIPPLLYPVFFFLFFSRRTNFRLFLSLCITMLPLPYPPLIGPLRRLICVSPSSPLPPHSVLYSGAQSTPHQAVILSPPFFLPARNKPSKHHIMLYILHCLSLSFRWQLLRKLMESPNNSKIYVIVQ